MMALLLQTFSTVVLVVNALPPYERTEQKNTIDSRSDDAERMRRPVHLDGVLLERDGELNKEFRQEVLLGGNDPKDPKELRAMVEKMFYETDENKDGALSLAELEARILNNIRIHLEEAVLEAQSHFNIVDTNKDGQVSWHEYKPHYLSKESYKDGHEHKNMDDYDSIADGERVSFDRADLNGDGLLDSEEWLRFFHPEHNKDSLKEMANDILKLYDKDGDGIVKRDEFSASRPSEKKSNEKLRRKEEREAEFDKQIDTNGDGLATLDEIFEYINPRNAKNLAAEASDLMDSLDTDGDHMLTLEELLKQDRLVEFSPLLSVVETLHDDL